MYFLGLGVVLVLLKWLEIGPVAQLAWWWVLAPFGAALLWWAWADASGYTKRKAMDRMDARAKLRREKQRDALGLGIASKKDARRR